MDIMYQNGWKWIIFSFKPKYYIYLKFKPNFFGKKFSM